MLDAGMGDGVLCGKVTKNGWVLSVGKGLIQLAGGIVKEKSNPDVSA